MVEGAYGRGKREGGEDVRDPTNPEPGVIATKPATAPEQKPTADHFLSSLQSHSIHVSPPTLAARFVTMHAWTARRFAPSADPPLNPNHPNHRKIVPRTT